MEKYEPPILQIINTEDVITTSISQHPDELPDDEW